MCIRDRRGGARVEARDAAPAAPAPGPRPSAAEHAYVFGVEALDAPAADQLLFCEASARGSEAVAENNARDDGAPISLEVPLARARAAGRLLCPPSLLRMLPSRSQACRHLSAAALYARHASAPEAAALRLSLIHI